MKRKIIQIAVEFDHVINDSNDRDSREMVIFALCDDGTIWSRGYFYGEEWTRMEAIPQD